VSGPCEYGKLKTEQLEKEIEEMKKNHRLLEDRIWKLVVGGQLIILIVQILGMVIK